MQVKTITGTSNLGTEVGTTITTEKLKATDAEVMDKATALEETETYNSNEPTEENIDMHMEIVQI